MKSAYPPRKIMVWRMVGLLTLAVLAWHLPLFWSGGSRPRVERVGKPMSRDLYVVMQNVPPQPEINPMLWLDPTVYLLPSEMGFSRNIYRKMAEPRLAVEKDAPPLIMDPFRVESLDVFFDKDQLLTRVLQTSSDSEVPFLEIKRPEENWSSIGSAWRVVGQIAGRLLQAGGPLPVVQAAEALNSTVLRIAINSQGEPLYVLVERSSGSDKADELGAGFARGLRFASSHATEEGPVVWGYLKILWLPSPVPPKV